MLNVVCSHAYQVETGPVPYTRRFTWEAMTSYIAQSTVGDELNQEHHWRTQFYHCGICSVDYNLITQLEHAKEETNRILEMKKWKGTVLNCSVILNLKIIQANVFKPKKGITHFGRQYTHAQKRSAEDEFSEYEQHFQEQKPLEQWSSLSKNTLKGIYRHFWLDFILLGYDVNEATDIIDLGHD